MREKVFSWVIGALIVALMTTGVANAQISFDEATYTSMADASSSATIPPGTTITLQNWQQYKQFMPVSMLAGFGQRYGWKISSDPKYAMVVGPTLHDTMFKQLRENTEKYAGQAKLRKVASGGYTMDGYVAGVPFPKPSGDLKAYQVFYNVWTYYFPSFTYFDDISNQLDRFRNQFPQGVDVQQWRMSHTSDEGFPTNPDYGKGVLQANRFFLKFPEQVKYTTQLALLPDNPEKLQEIYVFLPSLRRSLRLSSAARCSPILGSDWTQDDNGDGMFLQPPNFSMKLLGEKKVLAIMHAGDDHYYGGNSQKGGGEKLYDRSSMPGWPSPLVGKWELRDAYVLDIVPLPVMGSYCYAHKVVFVDKESFVQLYFDNYDASNKLYKAELIYYRPIPVNDTEKYWVRAQNSEVMIDWQNTHATTSLLEAQPILNKKCVALGDSCANVRLYAFPAGLSNIMR
jgi:Protein of unknown function (DUF1329)